MPSWPASSATALRGGPCRPSPTASTPAYPDGARRSTVVPLDRPWRLPLGQGGGGGLTGAVTRPDRPPAVIRLSEPSRPKERPDALRTPCAGALGGNAAIGVDSRSSVSDGGRLRCLRGRPSRPVPDASMFAASLVERGSICAAFRACCFAVVTAAGVVITDPPEVHADALRVVQGRGGCTCLVERRGGGCRWSRGCGRGGHLRRRCGYCRHR